MELSQPTRSPDKAEPALLRVERKIYPRHLLAVLPFLFAATLARAQTDPKVDAALSARTEYKQASKALRERLPEVAAVKLERLRESGVLTGRASEELDLLLAEAHLRAGKPARALELMDASTAGRTAEGKYWRALALARLDRPAEAARELNDLAVAGPGFRYAAEAAFSRAGVLAALGDPARALRALQPLLDSPNAPDAARARLWTADLLLQSSRNAEAAAMMDTVKTAPGESDASLRYLRARALLATGDPLGAEALFTSLAEGPKKGPPRIQEASALGRAQALRKAGRVTEALAAVQTLIGRVPVPTDAVLDAAFREYEDLNQPAGAEAATFLASWALSEDPALKARARMAQASALEAAGRLDESASAWATMEKELAANPLLPSVMARHAAFLISRDRYEEARALAGKIAELSPGPAVRAWAAWLRGRAAYASGKFDQAEQGFAEAAENAPAASTRAAAAYNAALSELQGGVTDAARSLRLLDEAAGAEFKMAGAEFHLERALYLASGGDPAAADGLTAFVEALPNHPRAFDAWIALAELALKATPPDAPAARRHLDAAAATDGAATSAGAERLALLKVFLAETEGGPAAFETEARAFLEAFPPTTSERAELRSNLRMRLAETLYRKRGNFSAARQEFQKLAEEDPMNPLAEPALFFAGKAAVLGLEAKWDTLAIDLWEQVFKRDGPLKWEARLQEALLYQRREKADIALQLLEEILVAKPPADAAIRWQARCVQGEILTGKTRKPEEVARGLAAFDTVAAEASGATPQWRQQALVKKGTALEQLGQADAALEAYYDVLDQPPAAEGGDDSWFHRAGDKGLRLLQGRGKYEEAVELARKMAKAPGPRGRAAGELVEKLLLDNHIWDDPR